LDNQWLAKDSYVAKCGGLKWSRQAGTIGRLIDSL